MRSSVAPQTIASETAQNTNWKKNFESTVAFEAAMTGNAVAGSPKPRKKKPVSPMSPVLPAQNAKAKPQMYHMIAAIEKFVRTFATIVPAFFWREKPISRNMKPHCMNMTTMPATMTHIVLTATDVRPTVCSTSPLEFTAASSVSAAASCGATSAINSPAPTAGSTFSAIVRLICPPPLVPPSWQVMVGTNGGGEKRTSLNSTHTDISNMS